MVIFLRGCARFRIPCRSGVTAPVSPPQLRRTAMLVPRPLLPSGSLMMRSATGESRGDQSTGNEAQDKNASVVGAAQRVNQEITEEFGFKTDEGKDNPVEPGMSSGYEGGGNVVSEGQQGTDNRTKQMGDRMDQGWENKKHFAHELREGAPQQVQNVFQRSAQLGDQAQSQADARKGAQQAGGEKSEGAAKEEIATENVKHASPPFKDDTDAGPADQSSG